MADTESNFAYRFMAWTFKIRDVVLPRKRILDEVGIEPGCRILDFGCGLGSYVVPAAEVVGQSGKVYALDIHPLAVRMVKEAVARKGVNNVETVQSDCATGLEDGSIDVVLLYDTYHDLEDPGAVLSELHRVLKPGGRLSFSDHHMKEDEIVANIAGGGLFRLTAKGKKTYTFACQVGPSQ
jgi:ubiquinone/menaquinone biosynthesis C-methylase UbiE